MHFPPKLRPEREKSRSKKTREIDIRSAVYWMGILPCYFQEISIRLDQTLYLRKPIWLLSPPLDEWASTSNSEETLASLPWLLFKKVLFNKVRKIKKNRNETLKMSIKYLSTQHKLRPYMLKEQISKDRQEIHVLFYGHNRANNRLSQATLVLELGFEIKWNWRLSFLLNIYKYLYVIIMGCLISSLLCLNHNIERSVYNKKSVFFEPETVHQGLYSLTHLVFITLCRFHIFSFKKDKVKNRRG